MKIKTKRVRNSKSRQLNQHLRRIIRVKIMSKNRNLIKKIIPSKIRVNKNRKPIKPPIKYKIKR